MHLENKNWKKRKVLGIEYFIINTLSKTLVQVNDWSAYWEPHVYHNSTFYEFNVDFRFSL
jgi:hypothetical protein